MTETVKREWQSVDIPKVVFEQLTELIKLTGNPSVAEYVRFAIKLQMKADRNTLEEIRLEDERTRI